MELRVQIVRYIGDEPQPGIVACEFLDADGNIHTLIDKVPIFSVQRLDAVSTYPQTGGVGCELVARWKDPLGRDLARITLARPWLVESTEGTSEFVVLATQLL